MTYKITEKTHVVLHLGMTLEEVERRYMLRVLARNGGDKAKTAEQLGVALKTIYNRLHAWGVPLGMADSKIQG